MISPLYEIASLSSVIAGMATTVVTLAGAFFALTSARTKSAQSGVGLDRTDLERIKAEIAASKPGTLIPFEIEQLASYYALSLWQARISFWFSLIFAAIGFVVIVAGAALYEGGEIITVVLKVSSGVIVDAVAALFFVQSRRAQESMSAFFEKLRSDRQFVEARKICEEITDPKVKDHLKTILVLQYSGLDPSPVTTALAGKVSAADGPIIPGSNVVEMARNS